MPPAPARIAVLIAVLVCATACSPSARNGDSPRKDPAPLRTAADCPALADAYLAAERDTVTAALAQIKKEQEAARPRAEFDTGLRDELRKAAERLKCPAEQWYGLMSERLTKMARDAGLDVPAGALTLVAAQQIDRRYHWHFGRVHMFTMLPSGKLTGQNGAPAGFAYDGERHQYIDEAGVTWLLWDPDYAVEHQPQGATGSPNKKFTAVDASGGSFEAILMPDGAAPGSMPTAPFRYEQGNWLTTGPLVGTYNYADSHSDHPWWFPSHFIFDMLPHYKNGQYPDARRERWIDPRGDWRTFVQRFERTQSAIRSGGEVIRRPDGSLAIAANGGPADGTPIDADLVPLLQEWLESGGVQIGGQPREEPIAGFNRIHRSDLPTCGPKPSEWCLSPLRDNGAEAVVAIVAGMHYTDLFLLRYGEGGWQVAESHELTLGDDNGAPPPAWVPFYLAGR